MDKLSVLNTFLDTYTTNFYLYETRQSLETLRGKIQFVIQQKEIFNHQYNLTGRLNADHSFKLTRRAGLGIIRSWDREPVTISGKITDNNSGASSIEVQFKPNFIFILFPIAFIALGIGIFVKALLSNEQIKFEGLFFFIFIPIMWGMAFYTKKYYKSEFERALGLERNDTIIKRSIKL